jgi:hypothetical protein
MGVIAASLLTAGRGARVVIVSSRRSMESYGGSAGADAVLTKRRGLYRALVHTHIPLPSYAASYVLVGELRGVRLSIRSCDELIMVDEDLSCDRYMSAGRRCHDQG